MVVVTPFLVVMAYFNMVARMGLPFSLDVFVGPMVVSVMISLILSLLYLRYHRKLHRIEVAKLQDLEETQLEVIMTLTEVAESRCNETGTHIKRVAAYTLLLGQLAGLEEDELRNVTHASPLHDIGKIGIADAILLKSGKYTDDEYEQMKQHAEIGYRILAESTKPILRTGAIIAQQHHERWDGEGYPNRLRGEEIHLYARIVAIVDVFDALSSQRSYKSAWTQKQITEYFAQECGQQFDPALTSLFLDKISRFMQLREEYEQSDDELSDCETLAPEASPA